MGVGCSDPPPIAGGYRLRVPLIIRYRLMRGLAAGSLHEDCQRPASVNSVVQVQVQAVA